VFTQPAHAKRDDGGEADGLKKQGDVQHGHTRVIALGDCRCDEDDAHRQVEQEHVTGADKFHETDAREASEGESTLGSREEFTSQRGRGTGASLGDVVDEVARDSDLSARVTKLGEGGVEEAVLLAEGFDVRVGVGFFGLEGHVCVGDFRDGREVEDHGEEEDEAGYGEVDPLHVAEGSGVFACVQEDYVGAEDGGDDGADAVEGLGEVDTEFGVARRTTDWTICQISKE
jgi:hypothetical protein